MIWWKYSWQPVWPNGGGPPYAPMTGGIPARPSVAKPPCSLIAHWIRFHCVYLLGCECSCCASVCVRGWRSAAMGPWLSIEDLEQKCLLDWLPTILLAHARAYIGLQACVWVLEGNRAEVRFSLLEGWTDFVEDCGCFWFFLGFYCSRCWTWLNCGCAVFTPCCAHPHVIVVRFYSHRQLKLF